MLWPSCKVPADAESQTITNLANDEPITLNVTVELDGDSVSAKGDQVDVEYRGFCTGNGEEFDSGEFPTTLGSGQTIPGFDLGLVGLAEGESVTLVLPDEIAYGDSPQDPCADVEPQGLRFDVTLTSIGA